MFANNRTVLKYIDFGLSKELENALTTRVGTPRYAAPELFNLTDGVTYTTEADIWYKLFDIYFNRILKI